MKVKSPLRRKHTLAVLGLNARGKTGAWDSQADVSYSDAWRKSLAGDRPIGCLPRPIWRSTSPTDRCRGAQRRAQPADPALQSLGGCRSNNGSNVNGTGESSGPEQTRDHLAAIALNFKRTIDQSFLSAVEFGGRFSDRLKSHHENQWGYCAGTGSTSFTIPNEQNSQVCPPGTAGQNGLPAISLANSGLSYFNAPSFTAPPLVYGNFDSLFPQVYPNPPSRRLRHAAGTHDCRGETYEGFAMLDFKTSLGSMPLTGKYRRPGGTHQYNEFSTSLGRRRDFHARLLSAIVNSIHCPASTWR